MKFSMFYIAEYSNMVTASALMTTLFFGGWDIPFTHWDNTPPWSPLKTVLTLGMFSLKVIGFLFVYIRSEEHTSELQSQSNLVCRLLLEKKKKCTTSMHTC